MRFSNSSIISVRIARISKVIRNDVNEMGYVLWGCELHNNGRNIVIRIYVDVQNRDGVTLENCSEISRRIYDKIVRARIVSDRHNFDLEVSSPGIDRPLFTINHYRRFIGRVARLKLDTGSVSKAGMRKLYKGTIKSVQNDRISIIDTYGSEIVIPISMIEKSRLVG